MTLLKNPPVLLDDNLLNSDVAAIRELATQVGVFNEEEVQIACELAIDTLSGRDPDYKFLFLRADSGGPLAYTCYGVIPFTDNRFDLYWIVVSPSAQGQGLGKKIMQATEERIIALGGNNIYAETSGTDHYTAARGLYLKSGFFEASVLKDFYKDGDDKIIYQKRVV
jgi:ribosomal protein S18 acetylase RimI-like enzyme